VRSTMQAGIAIRCVYPNAGGEKEFCRLSNIGRVYL
jgi:hypothetical protein